ncbi:biotin--[acetyl-CoA-carboxylase] ligase [Oxalobacter paraformigenes]|nr:biotin--[acetyl-CoA-carboxylase] ligase [Oxalobacter paraformigenes]
MFNSLIMYTVLESTESVLDYAWKMVADSRFPVFDALIAREQTAGRGQYGRTWISPRGNVYVAIRLPFKAPFDNTEAAMALSCCISATLADFGFDIKIKWTNDLVIEGGKVAGILLEQKNGKLVAGIGINLLSCPDSLSLRQNAALPATCLYAVNPQVARNLTPEIIVENLAARLRKLDLDSFSRAWRTEALSRLLWLNESVYLDIDGSVVTGTLAGIDERGGLLLATPDGMRTYMRGTIRKVSG